MVSFRTFLRARLLTQDLLMGTGIGVSSGALVGWLIEKGLVALDGGAIAILIPLGIAIGGIAGAVFGVAAGQAFTAPKSVVLIGFDTDFISYGNAAIKINCVVCAGLGAVALFPRHGLVGSLVGGLAGCVAGLLMTILTPVFAVTVGNVLSGLVNLTFNMVERYASDTLFSAEGLREREAVMRYDAGMRCDAQRRITDAIREYTRAIELLPEFPQAHHNLAYDYGVMGDVEAEIAGYLKAIGLKPDYKLAIKNLITTYRQNGNFNSARQWEESLHDLDAKRRLD